ncbi:acyltransferase family protein [Komagataeibacter oboediens]|uniref:acyltransferase family protein n=1 Tax=Komagataeibacter oboediens TaxID=65958 RepID=UPI0023DC469B|nr:acyltransferase family protein [Komagataeibacter oboediens]WEQ53251.1 acyltransferase family protein [Komagataeibacter oboediens]
MKGHIKYLDGIRGIASLSVVIFHFFHEALGSFVPVFRSRIFYTIFDGHEDVMIFFILSGDALSISYLRRKIEKTIVYSFIKRYFRLLFVVFVSSFSVYVLMKLHIDPYRKAQYILDNNSWVGEGLDFRPKFYDFLQYSFGKVFFGDAQNKYNIFLWTMQYEILGSFLVMLLCISTKYMKEPKAYILATSICLILFQSYVGLFMFGLFLSMMRSEGFFDGEGDIAKNLLLILCLILLIYIPNFIPSITNKVDPGYNILKFISCPLILLVICQSKMIQDFISRKFFIFLGKISFSLYGIHYVTLKFLFSYSVNEIGPYEYPLILSAIMCVLITMYIAYIVSCFESRYINYVNRAAKLITN